MAGRCMRCKIDIVDDTQECPLCHGVLDGENNSEDFVSVTYPNVAEILKLPILVIRIVIFASVIVLAATMIINYITFDGVYWSAIVAVGLFYGCFTLVLLLKERKSLQRNIQIQMWMVIILSVVMDYLLDFRGWSLKYAIPITVVAIDIGVIVFMIIKINGWQAFIMSEIVTFLISVINIVLMLKDITDVSLFAMAAVGFTGLVLLGTIWFGQRMISNEIQRRFQV